MLRFETPQKRATGWPRRSQTRGVWMLLLMLGTVLLLMRQVQQPQTVALLDRIFASPQHNHAKEGAAERRSLPVAPVALNDAVREPKSASISRGPDADRAWAEVKDNAMFLPAEHEAWFLLWEEARRLEPADLRRQSLGVASYAQLVGQPEVYRGQAVTIKGRVLRESVKPAPKNSQGITDYHQLILAPYGGGDWPITVYCLNLPPGFPRGDGIGEDVAIAGLFFKNWSYPYDGGMGISPVIVAKTFEWTAPAPRVAIQAGREGAPLAIGAAAAIVCALAFVVWVARQTRRPAAAESPRPDFRHLEAEL